ncbi:MAG: DUF6617 family protein [Bacteroidota bacterium]
MRQAKRTAKYRLEQFMISTGAKHKFNRINPELNNIKVIFQNNFKIWLMGKSDETFVLKGNDIIVHNGVMENPENVVTGNTKNGFELTKHDFIEAELAFFESIDTSGYDLVEKKQMRAYLDFLKKEDPIKERPPLKKFTPKFPIENLNKVYDSFKSYGFIDENTYYESFLKAFTQEFDSHKETVKFTITNPRIKYIMESLSPYFEGLNPTSAANSGKFLNNVGNLLNKGSMEAQKSRGGTPSEFENKVKLLLQTLTN